MATSKIANGDTLEITAAGTFTSGDVVRQGNLVGISLNSGVSGDTQVLALCGVYKLSKVSGNTFAQGADVYHDGTDCTSTATGNDLIGQAYAAAGSGTTTMQVRLQQPASTGA